jgi:hypothetical protein
VAPSLSKCDKLGIKREGTNIRIMSEEKSHGYRQRWSAEPGHGRGPFLFPWVQTAYYRIAASSEWELVTTNN